MRFLKVLCAALVLSSPAFAQTGTVTNHAFALGKGAGVTGYTSLLCTSAQLAVGQSAADPICQTITGDVTITAGGVTAIGTAKVTAAMIAGMTSAQLRTIISDEVGTGSAYFVGGALGTPASATLTNATGLPVGGLAAIAANTLVSNATAGSASPTAVAVPSCSGANQAINWTSGTGPGCITISTGTGPSVTAKTANYTIASGDCGNKIEASGGPWTLTLPAVTGFSAGCQVQICNVDPNDNTHHAIRLSGFPAPSMVRLWMGQCQTVSVTTGGAWTISSFPGLFRPSFTPKIFVDLAGSDTNDGLVSNASSNALRHIQACFDMVQSEFDLSVAILGIGIPTCGPTCSAGQIYIENGLNYQKGGNGNGGVYLIGQGGMCNLRTSTNVVLQMTDFAGYIIFANVNFDCTGAASHPCWGLYPHQHNIIDLSSAAPANAANMFTGAAAGDVAIHCDSNCKINSAIAPTLTGTFTNGIEADLNSNISLNNGLTIAASTTIGGNVLQFTTSSNLVWSGLLTLGASNSIGQFAFGTGSGTNLRFATFTQSGTLGGGGRQWAVLNNAFLCNGSATALPGSAGINSGSGYASGSVIATSGACSP
jgi:hypothetical protein